MDEKISAITTMSLVNTNPAQYSFNRSSEQQTNSAKIELSKIDLKPIQGRIEKSILQGITDKVTSYFKLSRGRNAEKIILKNVSKMIPLAGAVPSVSDAAKMYRTSITSAAPEARYLAKAGVLLNGTDAVLSVAEFFSAEFGIPVAADIALGSAELGLGVLIDSIETEVSNNTFVPSKELHTLIGLSAISLPHLGLPALVKEFRVSGALDVMKTTVETLLHR